MDQERLKLEPEVQEILKIIDKKENFLLSGGAGSGKTYSLVHTIRQILKEFPTAKVACITYTNAAVLEIANRVSHSHLRISTIHDFLWDHIKHFQKELRIVLVKIINSADHPKFKIDHIDKIPDDFFNHLSKGIQYKEYVRLKDGIISHEEVIEIASEMFLRYPKLGSILKSSFRCIFVDEYQDTAEAVVEVVSKV